VKAGGIRLAFPPVAGPVEDVAVAEFDGVAADPDVEGVADVEPGEAEVGVEVEVEVAGDFAGKEVVVLGEEVVEGDKGSLPSSGI
jgi:hypothetical protein